MLKQNNLKILKRIQKKEEKLSDEVNTVSLDEFLNMNLEADLNISSLSGGAPDEENININVNDDEENINEDPENEEEDEENMNQIKGLTPQQRAEADRLLKEETANMAKIEAESVLNDTITNFKGDEEEKSILSRFLKYQTQRNLGEIEGLYLIGFDLPTILKFVNDQFNETLETFNDPTKTPTTQSDPKIEKSLFELTGEYIDEDIKRVNQDVLGIRKEISSAVLKPEQVLNDQSSFGEIINESKKYHNQSKRNINPKALLTLVSLLHKASGPSNQWLRVASLSETIYQYYNQNTTRKQFFSKTTSLDETLVLQLNEFWKTDWVFRSPREKEEHRKNLDFYKEM